MPRRVKNDMPYGQSKSGSDFLAEISWQMPIDRPVLNLQVQSHLLLFHPNTNGIPRCRDFGIVVSESMSLSLCLPRLAMV